MSYLPQYTLGVDVSKWQGQMDWQTCANAGANFAIIRAGYGSSTPQTDTQFERNASLAPTYLPVGYYWYWRPIYDTIEQADYFSTLIENKPYNIRPVIDVEVNDNLSYTQMRDKLKQFANRVIYNLGKNPLIYTRTSFFDPYVATDPMWGDLDLWIARYSNTLTHPWGDGTGDPRDWDTFTFWQFSADGNGLGSTFGAESSAIDLDYFNGTIDIFNQYIGKEQPQPGGIVTTLIKKIQKTISGSAGGGSIVTVVPENEIWDLSAANITLDENAENARIVIRTSDNVGLVLYDVNNPVADKVYIVRGLETYLSPKNKILLSVSGNTVDLKATLSLSGILETI